ncbi:ribonuclease H-like domain-containing protein [Mycena amicta]|nr:ribonuclease H-like domain-containing protein [Mycena amicta]
MSPTAPNRRTCLQGAVVGDGGPNVRVARRLVHEKYPWIINIYDPCHNLNLFLKDLGKLFKAELTVISGISAYFAQSNISTAALATERKLQGVRTGIKSASETRFGTTYIQSRAIQKCMPALVECVASGEIEFKTAASSKLKMYLEPGPAHYGFLAQLDTMIKLLEAGANGIMTLEGQNSTCGNVFYVWVTIAWQLEQLLGTAQFGLMQYRPKVIEIYNARFEQMMTESSNDIFLLGYFLHPLYVEHGGIQLLMPAMKDGETLPVLWGEQQRTGNVSQADSDRLNDQLVRWAARLTPHGAHRSFTATDIARKYWAVARQDSNADILGLVAIIVFSIMPSEICDERTASLLGWINAARRSSMSPEHLIACAQLSQYYKNGFTEGNYTHQSTANVKVSDLGGAPVAVLSAPTLMDLLNEENVAPNAADREALEKALLEQQDPFDLEETERFDATIDADTFVTRSSSRWGVAEFVKLDSPALKQLISPGGHGRLGEKAGQKAVEQVVKTDNKPWKVDDDF